MKILDFKMFFEDGWCIAEVKLQGDEEFLAEGDTIRVKTALTGSALFDIQRASSSLLESIYNTLLVYQVCDDDLEKFIIERGCVSMTQVDGDGRARRNVGNPCGKCVYCRLTAFEKIGAEDEQ
jgi:hypothetical protein